MNLLIKNGILCDAKGFKGKKDIYIQNDVITEISENINTGADMVINAENKVVMPGLIDMHVHLREPGFEYKETIESGCRAAVAGGFTAICCMPNTSPVVDNESVLAYIQKKARSAGLCSVYPIAAITVGSKGQMLTEMGELREAGAIAFSDDGKPVENNRIMSLAMQYASAFDGLIISHCEDKALTAEGVMNEGFYSTLLGLKGAPSIAEALMVSRELLLSEYLNTRVHIAHVSSKESVELIKNAKARGVKVSAETCPHYLYADDSLVQGYDTNTKVNPPLRSKEDVQVLRDAIKNGIIDCIASDHAPHHIDEKRVEFQLAASGISGLETSFALCYTSLVRSGIIELPQLISAMAEKPAKILGIEGGIIEAGQLANLAVADIENEYSIDVSTFYSKGKNNPFNGHKVYGKVTDTIFKGTPVYLNGKVAK